MTPQSTLTLIAFTMAASAVLLVYTLVSGRRSRLDERLGNLDQEGLPELRTGSAMRGSAASQFAQATLPRLGTALMPGDEEERTFLRTRLIHAGFYGRQALAVFLGAKMVLIVAPALIGMVLGVIGIFPKQEAVLAGACLGIVGMIAPGFWIDSRKSNRQSMLRRALPDALDLLVVCLEGGLSLPGSLKRVGAELKTAHPQLAAELNIVQREIQLGRSPGESLKQLGYRTDLEEIRSLASVITQAERFGASLVKSLRVHADTLRLRRQQHAEELAQKATVKVLFPTLLFIFPAVFVVILGPAVFQVLRLFRDINNG